LTGFRLYVNLNRSGLHVLRRVPFLEIQNLQKSSTLAWPVPTRHEIAGINMGTAYEHYLDIEEDFSEP